MRCPRCDNGASLTPIGLHASKQQRCNAMMHVHQKGNRRCVRQSPACRRDPIQGPGRPSAGLTDLCYTLLLALDREANIGGTQQMYSLADEDSNVLTGGEPEVAAYEIL